MQRTAIALVLLALPLLADAQSYRCVGKDGKKYYGSSVPSECIGQPVELLNAQGMVTRRFDAAASAAERDKKAAEDEERKKREAISKEEGRRNRALLATYTSENEIDTARNRALANNQQEIKETEARVALLKKKRADLQKEVDAAPKGKPSAQLLQEVDTADYDIKAQEGIVAAKRKEADAINAKFDEDKRRYRELTGLDARARAGKLEEAKSVTIVNRENPAAAAARNRAEAESRARQDSAELRRIEAERSSGARPATATIPNRSAENSSAGQSMLVCGGTRIVCTPRTTVMCNGQAVACP